MDKRKDLHEIERFRNNGQVPAPINYGSWEIVFSKLGFMVRNTESPHRFHFRKDSNGWITGQTQRGTQMFNGFGPMPEGLPTLYDDKEKPLEKFS